MFIFSRSRTNINLDISSCRSLSPSRERANSILSLENCSSRWRYACCFFSKSSFNFRFFVLDRANSSSSSSISSSCLSKRRSKDSTSSIKMTVSLAFRLVSDGALMVEHNEEPRRMFVSGGSQSLNETERLSFFSDRSLCANDTPLFLRSLASDVSVIDLVFNSSKAESRFIKASPSPSCVTVNSFDVSFAKDGSVATEECPSVPRSMRRLDLLKSRQASLPNTAFHRFSVAGCCS
mmetsp:Transcript_17457/g.26507  ORF Transcript_17457/g.26507 Transcript_17457/m.26507 type:complete len:236 (-) Transcript_17457:184-891(-)